MEADPRFEGNAMYSLSLWDGNVNAVLGQYFDSQTTRGVYTVLTHDYCDRNEDLKHMRIKSTLEVIEIACDPDDPLRKLEPRFKKTFATAVDKAIIESGKGFPLDKRTLLLHHLPHDIPSNSALEVYKVPRDDSRVALRGQNGVRVKGTVDDSISAGAFLGVYRGRAIIDLSEYKDISNAPPGVEYLQFELEIESYTASCEQYNIGLKACEAGTAFEGMNINDPSYSQVHVCAARYGNITALVNDPHVNPMGNSIETVGQDNACLRECVVGGWPFLVMFASRDIQPGEELRYSYGYSFWTIVKDATKRLQAATGGAAGGGNGSGGSGGVPATTAANGGPLVDAAATPMRNRVRPPPSAPPSQNNNNKATATQPTNSDLAPTEEIEENSDEDEEGEDSDSDDEDETGGDSNGSRQPSRKRKYEEARPSNEQQQEHSLPAKKAKKDAVSGKPPQLTPTKAMLASPHGQRVKLYSSKSPLGRFQAENNGYASKEQFEAAKRLAEENPEIESGASSSSSSEEEEEEREKPGQRSSAKAATKITVNAANGNGAGPSAPSAAAREEEEEEETQLLESLKNAVEAGNVALRIAKRKLDIAEKLVEHHRRFLAELKPQEEEGEEAPSDPSPPAETAAQTTPAPSHSRPLWTKKPLFQIFIENSRGGDDLAGPWNVSQLERALETNRAPADREVFLRPELENSEDVEMLEALESLGPLPEAGMWKLAELLDAAHPEALQVEDDETPAAARAAAAAAAAAAQKRKRLDPKQARALKHAEKQLSEALEKVEEKQQLVQEKERALSAAKKELQQALGEDDEEEEEEMDSEVIRANERAAGKRPASAVDAGASTWRGRAKATNGNLTIPIGPDGAGTSAAHAALGAEQIDGNRAGLSPGKTGKRHPPAGAAAGARPALEDDVVDLTFDSDSE